MYAPEAEVHKYLHSRWGCSFHNIYIPNLVLLTSLRIKSWLDVATGHFFRALGILMIVNASAG